MIIRIKDTIVDLDTVACVQPTLLSSKDLSFYFKDKENPCTVTLASKQERDEKLKYIADLMDAKEI